jgi:hypothetical protein
MVRRLGYKVFSKEGVFGQHKVPDVEWIAWADERDLVALVKDDRIRRNRLERQALLHSTLRVFCLTNGNLTKAEQVSRFEARWPAIIRRCAGPGPFVCGVYSDRIEDLRLSQDRDPM